MGRKAPAFRHGEYQRYQAALLERILDRLDMDARGRSAADGDIMGGDIGDGPLPEDWREADREKLAKYLEGVRPDRLLEIMGRPEMTVKVKRAPRPGIPPVDREWNLAGLYEAVCGSFDGKGMDSRLVVRFLRDYAGPEVRAAEDGAEAAYDAMYYIAMLLDGGAS